MDIEEMKKHSWTVSWSGGKDSTATILLMHELGIPIDKIIYIRMLWDETIPATLPAMTDFVDKATKTFREWGYTVEIIPSIKTAEELANRIYKKSIYPEKIGEPYGALAFMRGHCNFSGVKTDTIKKHRPKDAWEMIGYRADETDRIHRLGGNKQSILVELRKTEEDRRKICEAAGMLSPLYNAQISRDGCDGEIPQALRTREGARSL